MFTLWPRKTSEHFHNEANAATPMNPISQYCFGHFRDNKYFFHTAPGVSRMPYVPKRNLVSYNSIIRLYVIMAAITRIHNFSGFPVNPTRSGQYAARFAPIEHLLALR